MSMILTDEEIANLLKEPKGISSTYRDLLKPRRRQNHHYLKRYLDIAGDKHAFGVYTCQHPTNARKFSAGLTILQRGAKRPTPLIRCNGWHSPHTNSIENRVDTGITRIPRNTNHIHYLTERYQVFEQDNHDGYAEPSSEFRDLWSAVDYLIETYNFHFTDGDYRWPNPLFREGAP